MPRKARPDALTRIQHLILAAAARHPEHRTARPDDVRPPSYRSALQALRRRGLVADDAGQKGSGRRAGPVISDAGLALVTPVAPAPADIRSSPAAEPAPILAPRSGTKLARLVAMLARPDGASLDELAAAAAWLPHTTRAALTGLRRRGVALTTVRAAGAPTRYRIVAADPTAIDAAATIESESEETAR